MTKSVPTQPFSLLQKLLIVSGALIALGGAWYFSQGRADTTLGLTLTTNQVLEKGLQHHWTFDGSDVGTSTIFNRIGSVHGQFVVATSGVPTTIYSTSTSYATTTYTSDISTTYTTASNAVSVTVEAWGAGGGGGGSAALQTRGGGGGGGGEYAKIVDFAVSPSTGYTVVVGNGGSGNTGNGGSGGDTYFNTTGTIRANGGGGGEFNGGNGGSGGSGGVGDVTYSGGAGGDPDFDDTGGGSSAGIGADGADGTTTAGGTAPTGGGDGGDPGGNPGTAPGGGGGGNDSTFSGSASGADGADGKMIIVEKRETQVSENATTTATSSPSAEPGPIGQGYRTSGIGDYIDFGNAGSGNQTVAFWLKTSSSTQYLVDLNGSAYVWLSNGTLTATGFTSPTIYVDSVQTTTFPTDVNWHHVVITTGTAINASDMDIGRVEGQGFADAAFDDLRLYSDVLTKSEVERLYSLGNTTRVATTITTNPDLEDSLAAHWTLDGPMVGTSTVYDRSSNAKHATLPANSVADYGAGATQSTPDTYSYVVPGGVTKLTVKAWGGGGGGGYRNSNTDSDGGGGGGGAFAQAVVSVTPGETLSVLVGGGGATPPDLAPGSFGDSGAGGGCSAVERSGTPLVIAAGGGGGAGAGPGASDASGGYGGGGGTTSSGNAGGTGTGITPGTGGGGGTSSAGGAGGTGVNSGAAGSSEMGGAGADGDNVSFLDGSGVSGGYNGGGDAGLETVSGAVSGGGGGCGYYGGGGGGSRANLSFTGGGGGGGGGSSYVTGESTTVTAGSNGVSGSGSGAGGGAANTGDDDYAGSAGVGGDGEAGSAAGEAGTAGRVVLMPTYALSPEYGAIGQGLSFTGGQYVTAGNVSTDIKTIAFWLKTSSNTQHLIDLNGSAYIWLDDGTITTAGFTSPTIYINGVEGASLSRNTWQHVVITTGTAINASDMDIGRVEGQGFADAAFDDVRLYTKELTAQEVRRLYDLGGTSGGGNELPLQFLCGVDAVQDVDGNIYSTVLIGTQCWMRQNMRVGTRVDISTGQTDNSTIERWCYDDSDANCDTSIQSGHTYPDGGLYQWDEAMKYSTTPGAQGICPDGWHIPTDTELHTLENYLATGSCSASRSTVYDCDPAGTALKPGGSSGFEFNLAGVGISVFGDRGLQGQMWSSSESGTLVWRRVVSIVQTEILRGDTAKSRGLSVRCLRDSS